MASELTLRIQQNPRYRQLLKTRDALSWRLMILVFLAYYGFILVIAFDKSLFATPVAAGMVTTWGIAAGFGVILLTIVATAVYVRKANRDYDRLVKELLAEEVGT